MNKKTETYQGFSLVSAYKDGEYQGKIFSSGVGEIIHIFGNSLEKVMKKLKRKVDSGKADEKLEKKIAKRHKKHLKKYKIPRDAITLKKRHKNSKERDVPCYECHSQLNSKINLECSRCGWMVCPCGTCGCGHPEYENRIRPYLKSKLHS